MKNESMEPVPVTHSIRELTRGLETAKYLHKVYDEIVGVAFDLNDSVHELPEMADTIQAVVLDKTVGATREAL